MNTEPCPNSTKGVVCDVCGGTYVCLEPWRKQPTESLRLAARNTFEQERAAARKREQEWRDRQR